MAKTWLYNIAPSGTAITTGNNLSIDGTAGGVMLGDNTIVSDNAHSVEGGLSLKVTNTGTGGVAVRLPADVASDKGALRFYFFMESLPPGNVESIATVAITGATYKLKLGVLASGKLWGRDTTQASFGTTAEILSANQWYRCEIVYAPTAATINVYKLHETTPYAQFPQALNFSTSNAVEAQLGMPNTPPVGGTTWPIWFDAATFSPGATTEIGPYAAGPATLGAPTLTVTSTQPSAAGLSDGTVTASWTAVPDAAAYESCILVGDVTTGAAATRSDGTRTRTFTGLAAGTRTVAVRAV